MSGIYIPNISMPEEGWHKVIKIFSDGTVVSYYDSETLGKAIPVPPHGDLIERKAAYDSLLDGMVMTGYQSRALDCIAEYSVPTIIPADKEGEG